MFSNSSLADVFFRVAVIMDLAAGTKERAVARRCLVATEPGDARPGSNCAVGVSEG